MAVQTYYDNLSDIDLSREALANTVSDLYIQKYEYIGSGVLAIETGGTSTLTPSTSPSWTADKLISTVADNLIVYDDNSKAASGKVADNDEDCITFDETAMLLDEDGATAPSFTVGNTYQFYVLTPSSVTGATYGPFWGYTEGVELNINDTFKKFMYGMPKKLKFKDLEMRECTIAGGHINYTNKDVMEDMFGAVEYGLQTSQYALGVGFEPDTDKYYRLTFVTEDRYNRSTVIRARKCQFEVTGNILQTSEAGYAMAGFNIDVISDGFYPVNADMLQIYRID